MPMLAMLLLMMAELCAYGLVAGLLRGIVAGVAVIATARVVLTAATAIAVFAFGSSKAIAATWTSDPGRRPARKPRLQGRCFRSPPTDRVADRQAQPLI